LRTKVADDEKLIKDQKIGSDHQPSAASSSTATWSGCDFFDCEHILVGKVNFKTAEISLLLAGQQKADTRK
jgi:hypothetical protein